MRGDPVVMGRILSVVILLFLAVLADVAWEIRKWFKK